MCGQRGGRWLSRKQNVPERQANEKTNPISESQGGLIMKVAPNFYGMWWYKCNLDIRYGQEIWTTGSSYNPSVSKHLHFGTGSVL